MLAEQENDDDDDNNYNDDDADDDDDDDEDRTKCDDNVGCKRGSVHFLLLYGILLTKKPNPVG